MVGVISSTSGASVGAVPSRRVALVAHWDWVLHNFRLPIARRLRERGLEVTLITPPGPYVERFAAEDYPWLEWNVDRRGMNPLRETRSIYNLARIYRRERFDVVHHFTIKPNLYGTIAARAAKIPIVLNTFTGLGFVFSDSRQARAIRTLVVPLMRWAFRPPSVWMIFQNEGDRDLAFASRFASPDRTKVIFGSGVDTDFFKPVSHPARRKPTVVMAARLLREKGVEDLIEAARILASEGMEATFVVAGEPDLGNPSAISEDQIASWAREGVVQFLGHKDDIRSVLVEADIAVLPTYYPEGLPRFLLEAAAMALPLVATDIPQCRQIVHEGENGFVVPPRAPDALAAALGKLIRSPALRTKFGANSRRIAMERFDEASVMDSYFGVYEAAGATR